MFIGACLENGARQIYLQWKTNRKSYMAYQMPATPRQWPWVTLKVIHRLHSSRTVKIKKQVSLHSTESLPKFPGFI